MALGCGIVRTCARRIVSGVRPRPPSRPPQRVLQAPVPASARIGTTDSPIPGVSSSAKRACAPVPVAAATSSSQVQRVFIPTGEDLVELVIPAPDEEVLPGIAWGRVDQFLTPAYWRVRACSAELSGEADEQFALGATLFEEVAACLLGGHGIPAEVGLAAYERLRVLGLLDGTPHDAGTLAEALAEPLLVGKRRVRYRFARQRSAYLGECLRRLANDRPAQRDDRMFRNWLASLPGLGLKTASWVTRNHRASDAVAILDVHLHRAGVVAGFFFPRHALAHDYHEMEDRFIGFGWTIGVRPSVLDALMWRDMKVAGRIGRQLYHLRLSRGAVEVS